MNKKVITGWVWEAVFWVLLITLVMWVRYLAAQPVVLPSSPLIVRTVDHTKNAGPGIDGSGDTYSATLMGESLTFKGEQFTLDNEGLTNVTVPIQAGAYSSIELLGTAVDGNKQAQVLKVTYADGTSTSYTQSFSDWYTAQKYAGESIAATYAYRNTKTGAAESGPFHLYAYSLPLDTLRVPVSITLPANENVVILSMSLTAYIGAQQALPRCLPGDYPANFHTGLDAAGDTLGVLWCDDAQGVGVSVLGGTLASIASAAAPCLSVLKQAQWTLVWEQRAWNFCVTSTPTPAQSAAAQAFAAKWVPHLTAFGGPILSAEGSIVGTALAGQPCGLARMPNSVTRYQQFGAGFTLCAISYPPSTGW